MDEPVVGGVDVRVVDLVGVAGEDDLRPVPDARDDRLHLVRRQVLRLVHVANRFKHERLAGHVTMSKGERSPLAELAANLL